MIGLGLIYLIHQRPEITGANYLNNDFWGDTVEELPDGSSILVRDIKKALGGESFGYIPKDEKTMTFIDPVDGEAFSYYFRVYMYTEKFGLPCGNGWMNELSWVPQLLSYFDGLKNCVEAWRVNHTNHTDGGHIKGIG